MNQRTISTKHIIMIQITLMYKYWALNQTLLKFYQQT